MRQTPVNDYLEDISTELPEEIYGHLSDAIYETVCEFDEEVAQLKADNARLRSCLSDDAENARMILGENAKLRELVRSVLVLRHDRVFKWLDAAVAEVFGTSFTDQARELGVEVG